MIIKVNAPPPPRVNVQNRFKVGQNRVIFQKLTKVTAVRKHIMLLFAGITSSLVNGYHNNSG